MEVGAGAGTLAALFHYELGSKIVIVDLPEMLICSGAFLLYTFPTETSFLLPGESINGVGIDDYDIVLLTPDEVDRIPEGSFDFGVNIHSFQEMEPSEVTHYFHLFDRSLSDEGFFFCANRRRKTLEGLKFFDYPWEVMRGYQNVFLERSRLQRQAVLIDQMLMKNPVSSHDSESALVGSALVNRVRENLRHMFLKYFPFVVQEAVFWIRVDLGRICLMLIGRHRLNLLKSMVMRK